MKTSKKANDLFAEATLRAQSPRPDRKSIVAMLERAAELGSGQAAWALGDWARRGVGGKSNPTRAVRYYRLAAELGAAFGAFDYAHALERGYGVRKSERKARNAYQLAAMLGDAQGAFEYYRCLWHGLGGAQDRVLARAVRVHFEKLGQFTARSSKNKNVRYLQSGNKE